MAFTKKKRVPHKRKKVYLKLLKPFRIHMGASIEPQRKCCDECPGSFSAVHKRNGGGKGNYYGHYNSTGK
jgi:hypothetical protein